MTWQRWLDALRCVNCGTRLQQAGETLQCVGHGHVFPMADGIPLLLEEGELARQSTAGHMEALFRFPAFYRTKFSLLSKLNPIDRLHLDDLLRNQLVLDAGCGPFSYGYDTTLPAGIVGLDLSQQFVRAIRQQDPKNLYLVANAKRIPFADKTFDTTFLRFVIHHVPGDTSDLLREVTRVTKGHVVIFDHVRSSVAWQSTIQTWYWKAFDSGHHYNSMQEWDELLKPYRVVDFRRTGRMFANICQILLDVRGAA